MRRLPVYFLIDVSESMVGEPIKQVDECINSIIFELRKNPYALETAYISIIAFAGSAHVITPLTELCDLARIPELPIGDGTSLNEGLICLMNDMERSIQKNTKEKKGDWKPIIFLLTDGVPTDNTDPAISRWNKEFRTHCNMIAVSLGSGADTDVLSKLTDTVFRLSDVELATLTSFFKWVTASIEATSVALSINSSDTLNLPKFDGINLEKINHGTVHSFDDRFVVLSAKCSKTDKPYLIKYERDIVGGYDIVGAYPIDGTSYKKYSSKIASNKIFNTKNLHDNPSCPCCGNEIGMVSCGVCGKISCAGLDGHCLCAWCGNEGHLTMVDSLDVTRGLG